MRWQNGENLEKKQRETKPGREMRHVGRGKQGENNDRRPGRKDRHVVLERKERVAKEMAKGKDDRAASICTMRSVISYFVYKLFHYDST